MKITIKHYDSEFSAEITDESCLSEVLLKLAGLLKLVGYSFNGELVVEDQQYLD